MINFIMLMVITGIFLLLSINYKEEKVKLSSLFTLAIPMGIGIHTFIFLILAYLKIYYSIPFMIIITALIIMIFCYLWVKKKTKFKLENDLKEIPIYYLIFALFLLYKFICLSSTSLANFYNWDELSVYQYVSKVIFVSKDFSVMYQLFAPMSYFIGSTSYAFAGLSLGNPRIFGGIFFVIMSFIIYFALRDNKVNRHISALLSMIFLISSAEVLLYYQSFYNNVYYAMYFLGGMYLFAKHYFIDKKSNVPWVGLLMILFAMLTRRESSFHMLGFFAILLLYFIFKKNKIWKQFACYSLIPIWVLICNYIFTRLNGNFVLLNGFYSSSTFSKVSKIDLVIEKLQPENLSPYLHSMFNSMFKFSQFSSNYILFILFFMSIILIIISVFKKTKNKKRFDSFNKVVVLSELIFLGIIVATNFLLFTTGEFVQAHSFSRYMMMIVPINFIVIGINIFGKEPQKDESVLIEGEEIIMKPKVLLIIPAYNEEENILNVYNTIKEHNKNESLKYDVLVVNDGSSDNTEKICLKNNINYLTLIHNLGIGGAVQSGYKYALENDYDIAIQFDGDGQHNVSYVKNIIKPIIDGEADMVIGSRFIEKDDTNFKSSLSRRIGIHIISFFIKVKTGIKIYDPTSGFRACNKKIIKVFANDYPYEYPEPITNVQVIDYGYKIKEVFAKMNERVAGTSFTAKKIWIPVYYMINVILLIMCDKKRSDQDD